MFEIDGNLQQILLIHLVICFFFYKYKPDFMFDNNGNFKQFGTGPGKTIYPFWLVTTVSSLSVHSVIMAG